MQKNFVSVPFKTESGLSQINGMAKFSPAGIVLEFESKLFGIINDGVKEARIATHELLDVRFRKGVFKLGARIVFRLKDFAQLSKLPSRDGKVTLKIKREDFDRAREAVEKLNKSLLAQQDALPPAHTPVSRLFDESEEITEELNRKNE